MFQPQVFFEMGRSRSGVALIPFAGATSYSFYISTRVNNVQFLKGDGTAAYSVTTNKNQDYTVTNTSSPPNITYGSTYNGNLTVIFPSGTKDAYSIRFADNRHNVQDIKEFFSQFSNLYSVMFDIYSYQSYTTVIKGDFSQLPDSVERVKFVSWEIKNNGTDQWLNLSNYSATSKLKYFDFSREYVAQPLKIIGDLGKLPPLVNFFRAVAPIDGAITYTAGKVWASSFDTLSIPLPLSHTELDSLLIDMDNSITTKIGAGVIALGGYRSATSDAAVASLQAKGFTVNVNRVLNNVSNSDSALLRLDFQNNFDVYSNSGMNIAAGGTSNQPTFALSGRKPGEYCAVFNGSQSIKTTANLPINSDKVTVAYWMKTTQTVVSVITELSPNTNANNAFQIIVNNVASSGKLGVFQRTTGAYNSSEVTGANSGTWKHFAIVIDRSLTALNEVKIYENGALAAFTKPDYTDTSGNFVNNILFIGQRAGSTSGFNGMITRFRIENYPYTATDVTNLYNSEV